MAVLGLRFCARAFSSCCKWGPLFIAVRGPLIIAASLAAEHKLQTLRLSNCGSRAQLLCSMWDPPRPGLEPVSPALAGRFSTTAPPGKPGQKNFEVCLYPCPLRRPKPTCGVLTQQMTPCSRCLVFSNMCQRTGQRLFQNKFSCRKGIWC